MLTLTEKWVLSSCVLYVNFVFLLVLWFTWKLMTLFLYTVNRLVSLKYSFLYPPHYRLVCELIIWLIGCILITFGPLEWILQNSFNVWWHCWLVCDRHHTRSVKLLELQTYHQPNIFFIPAVVVVRIWNALFPQSLDSCFFQAKRMFLSQKELFSLLLLFHSARN